MSKSFLPFLIAMASLHAVASEADRSSLAQEPVLNRVSPVVQFGAPNESKYVFCFEGQCPGRSQKTIRVVEPEPVKPVPVVEADLSLDEREEIVPPAQVKKVKKVKRRVVPKAKVRQDCAAPAK